MPRVRTWVVPFRWAWEQLRPRLGQVLLAVVVIALAVGLTGAVLLANEALQRAFEDSVDALAGNAQVQVTARSGAVLDETILARVRAVPGVEAAAPLLLGTVFLQDERGGALRIVSVDMLDDATIRLYEAAPTHRAGIEDPLVFLSQADSIIVTESFVEGRGLELEDSLEIQAASGFRQLTVRGVLRDAGVGLAFGGNVAVMDLYSAQELLGLPRGVTQVDVRVQEAPSVSEVAERLRQAMPAHVKVELVSDRKEAVAGHLAGFQLLFDIIAAFCLLLGGLITANRLSTMYEGRSWEIGLVRSLGMGPHTLMLRLMTEAGIIALLGVAIGLPLAIGLAQVVVGPLATAMTVNFRQDVAAPWVPPSAVPLAVAGAAGLLSGLAAAWAPAARAARENVAEVLVRGRSREPRSAGSVRNRGSVWALPVALVLLGIVTVRPDSSGVVGGLSMFVAGLAGWSLLQPGLRLVSRWLARLLGGGAASIGLEDQSATPGRAIGAATVLMIGGAVVVFVSNTGRSFEHFVLEAVTSPRRADLIVDSSANVNAMGEGGPRVAEGILDDLKEIAGVASVAGETVASASEPETGLQAVDPDWLRTRDFGDWLLAPGAQPDALEQVARGEAVLANFPPHRPVAIGDTIQLTTPSGPLQLPVAGLFRGSCNSPAGDLLISRHIYRDHWHDPTLSLVSVLVSDGASVRAVEQSIRKELGPRYGLRVMSSGELSEWFGASVRRGFAIANAIGLLTLVVVLLGTADALAANVLERTRDIGTMRSLGCSPAAAAGMIFAQALAIGLVGAALAVAVGMAWSVAFVGGLVPPLVGWDVQLTASGTTVLSAAGLGVGACLAGAAVPAIRAARLPVVQVLRYE